ncbi:MAG: ParA family protein [Alphaproteobacteria bacterium]|nr:ParA family protein [Alphaproteobacteria bacterium]
MAVILTVAQQKGGAGKTTLVAQLAAAFAAGRRVAVLDIDPQRSLARWHARRQQALDAAAAGITFAEAAGWRLAGEIDRLKAGHDIVLIDSPPHAETEARLAVRAADLVLVPVQPSPLDLWATQPTLDLARAEKRAARLVLNRMPARGRLADLARDEIARGTDPALAATLGNRTAFAAAMAEGLGVTEAEPRSLAAEEVRALAEEIRQLAGNRL